MSSGLTAYCSNRMPVAERDREPQGQPDREHRGEPDGQHQREQATDRRAASGGARISWLHGRDRRNVLVPRALRVQVALDQDDLVDPPRAPRSARRSASGGRRRAREPGASQRDVADGTAGRRAARPAPRSAPPPRPRGRRARRPERAALADRTGRPPARASPRTVRSGADRNADVTASTSSTCPRNRRVTCH